MSFPSYPTEVYMVATISIDISITLDVPHASGRLSFTDVMAELIFTMAESILVPSANSSITGL